MNNIAINIEEIRERVCSSLKAQQRSANAVTVLAVSKGRSSAEIRQAMAAGIEDFGESYLQEASAKITNIDDSSLRWHFIGPIQANKTRTISQLFQWVHTVDRLKIAQRLSTQRPEHLPPLNICIQVNIDKEASKAGISLPETASLAKAILALPRLKLRGLMIIPQKNADKKHQQRAFSTLAKTLDTLKANIPDLDTLSMGMSDDYPLAVQEGATCIRLGTAIFGSRAD
ncbi:MAG TPA: YggS family pyridoxal phosphate-dependent enzyme [Pseudomonadales bacterium]